MKSNSRNTKQISLIILVICLVMLFVSFCVLYPIRLEKERELTLPPINYEMHKASPFPENIDIPDTPELNLK